MAAEGEGLEVGEHELVSLHLHDLRLTHRVPPLWPPRLQVQRVRHLALSPSQLADTHAQWFVAAGAVDHVNTRTQNHHNTNVPLIYCFSH